MEDSRLLQQLHPPLPPGEGLVLRCGRGAGGVPRQNNVSRNIFPEFGPPPMLAADNSENPARLMRSNSFTGRIPPQHGYEDIFLVVTICDLKNLMLYFNF